MTAPSRMTVTGDGIALVIGFGPDRVDG